VLLDFFNLVDSRLIFMLMYDSLKIIMSGIHYWAEGHNRKQWRWELVWLCCTHDVPESCLSCHQWRRQDFITGGTGGSEVWVYKGSRVRSPPVPVVLSVYQRGSLLDGLAMYLSCDTKKFHDNESTHMSNVRGGHPPIKGKLPPSPLAAPLPATVVLLKTNLSSATCLIPVNICWDTVVK